MGSYPQPGPPGPSVPVWPIGVLTPERPMWEIVTGQVTGGQNLQGWTQTGIFGGGGFWGLQLGRVVIFDDPNQHLTWRAFQALMDAGASPIIVGYPDYSALEEIWPGASELCVHSDGTPFSDSSVYQNGGASVINVGAAAINATTITANVLYGPQLQAGMVFSALDDQLLPRRYLVRSATLVSGTTWTLKIRPWLRAALADQAILNFANPSCVMKLKDPKSIFADALADRWAEPSPVLEEWFGTLPTSAGTYS